MSDKEIEHTRYEKFIVWYFTIGYRLASLPAGLLSFVLYIWCISNYGFLFGLGLGWLPSLILAMIVFSASWFLWGPVILFVGTIIWLIVRSRVAPNSPASGANCSPRR